MVADAVRHVGGDLVEVEALMGPGVDPHYYKATQGDLKRLRAADVVIYNGLQLEGKLEPILEKLGSDKPVIAVAQDLMPSKLLTLDEPDEGTVTDPHIWHDVSLWMDAVRTVVEELALAYPEHKSTFSDNGAAYIERLKNLHEQVRERIAGLPESRRLLLTSHDAFGYFARAYGLKVRSLQGISTVGEFGLKDVANMVDFIVENDVPAIFTETTNSAKPMQAVLRGAADRGRKVGIRGPLYTDALGEAGTPEGTYIGMIEYNLKTITEALAP